MSTLRSGRTLPTPPGPENQPSSSRTDGGGTGAVPTRTEPTPYPNSKALYLLECKLCFKQYVGETSSSLRSRMKRHRNMSTQATRRLLYSHLQIHQKPFAATYSLSIIEQIKDTTQRKTKEAWYYQQFKTKIPFGFNVINNS